MITYHYTFSMENLAIKHTLRSRSFMVIWVLGGSLGLSEELSDEVMFSVEEVGGLFW